MKALIEVSTNTILTLGNATEYGGPWGHGIAEGTLKIVDCPDGEQPDELLVVAGVVKVDAVKKAARVAEEGQHENLLAKIKAIKKADLSDVDKCAAAILDIAKVLRKLAKGE